MVRPARVAGHQSLPVALRQRASSGRAAVRPAAAKLPQTTPVRPPTLSRQPEPDETPGCGAHGPLSWKYAAVSERTRLHTGKSVAAVPSIFVSPLGLLPLPRWERGAGFAFRSFRLFALAFRIVVGVLMPIVERLPEAYRRRVGTFGDRHSANRFRIAEARPFLHVHPELLHRSRNVHLCVVVNHVLLQTSRNTQRDVRRTRQSNRRTAGGHAVFR